MFFKISRNFRKCVNLWRGTVQTDYKTENMLIVKWRLCIIRIRWFSRSKFMLIFSLPYWSNNRLHEWTFFYDFYFVNITSKRFDCETFCLWKSRNEYCYTKSIQMLRQNVRGLLEFRLQRTIIEEYHSFYEFSKPYGLS